MHQWVSTDEANEDSCLNCGVVTPDFGIGVMSDHSPLPIWCPNTTPYNAHHFVGDKDSLTCAFCTVTIDGDTLPADVSWECRDDNHPPIPTDHPNYVEEQPCATATRSPAST